jgi:ligand-binding sensor domain-containing protein/DNA-binding CsgD family transcriptional regulator
MFVSNIKRLLVLGALISLFACSNLSSQGIKDFNNFQRLSIEHGLSQSVVTCMIQDSNGFLWFGTQDGLNRYDGYSFKFFCHDPEDPNSLSESVIDCLFEDKSGNIWIGTAARGLNRYNPVTGAITYYRYDPDNPGSISSDYVRSIHEDRFGNLWVGALDRLNRYDPQKDTFQNYLFERFAPNSTQYRSIRSICSDPSGLLWVGGYRIGLATFDPVKGQFRYIVSDPHRDGCLPTYDIDTIWPAKEHYLWIGTLGHGLFLFDTRTGTCSPFFPKPPQSLSADPITVTAMANSRAQLDILWITTTKGLLKIDSNRNEIIEHIRGGYPPDLNTDNLVSVMEDMEGNVWVSEVGKGLKKFFARSHVFESLKHQPGISYSLGNNIVYAILEDTGGDLWIGTGGGGIDRFSNSSLVARYRNSPSSPHNLRSDSIRDIIQDSAGDIWVATLGDGLKRIDRETGAITHFLFEPENPNSISSNLVRCLLQDHMGILWIGTPDAGINSIDPKTGTITRYFSRTGNLDDAELHSLQTIYEDSHGTLWFGMFNKGLMSYDRERTTFRYFNSDPEDPYSINCNNVISIHEGSRGKLWVGTLGGGLNCLDRSTGRSGHYTVKDGLPNNVIYGILEDSEQRLWLSTNRGLACLDPDTRNVTVFNQADGLPSNEFNLGAYFQSNSGRMYFGSLNGLVSFDPDSIKKSTFVPPVVFTSFKLLNRDIGLKRSISHLKELKLSYKDTFVIEFAALSYLNPAKNQYAYKLSGLQDEWIPLGNKRTLNFAYLEPGDYNLIVKGTNGDGVWNETGASIRLIITPPVWQTWWFKLLVILSIIAIAYRWHKAKLKETTLRLKTESAMNSLFTRFRISDREREILQLILKGKTNKDIEDSLYISLNTVKSHVFKIYRKMGVKSRLELINFIQKSLQE